MSHIKPQVIVLDVYETLLDMSECERKINLLTDSKRGYTLWLELFMQYCFANNSFERFDDFISIAKATLQMTAYKLGRTIHDSEINDVMQLLKHLPVHEEVGENLSRLNDMGYTIIGLTNAPEKIVCDRMERTGLISYFEHVLSCETVKKYKPHQIPYQWAAQKINKSLNEMLMVTAHGWDIAGAANVGMNTAFLKRGRQLLYPLAPAPDIICKNLSELVGILENERQGPD